MSKDPPVNHVVQTASLARAAKEKLRIVMAAAALAPDELGAFLRREGVHEADLQQWREAVAEGATSALENGTTRFASRGADTRRIKELERELRRKDRALAETAALLVLQKKVHDIWGDGDDGTGEGNAK